MGYLKHFKMARKFKPGNHVMLKKGGMPMTVTMYVNETNTEKETICVTWSTLDGKTKTARYPEDELVLFSKKEWNGKLLDNGMGD